MPFKDDFTGAFDSMLDEAIEEITGMILVALSRRRWHDLMEACPDPEAVACLGTGTVHGNQPMFLLCRYADGEFRLVAADNRRPEWRNIAAEQHKLQWLWERASFAVGEE